MIGIWWMVAAVLTAAAASGVGVWTYYNQRVEELRQILDKATAELEKISKDLAKLVQENVELGRKEKMHREANEQFEEQSKQAWARYRAAGLMAGNAQSILLRELEAAVRHLNKYREDKGESPIEVNPSLQPMVAEFKREHSGT